MSTILQIYLPIQYRTTNVDVKLTHRHTRYIKHTRVTLSWNEYGHRFGRGRLCPLILSCPMTRLVTAPVLVTTAMVLIERVTFPAVTVAVTLLLFVRLVQARDQLKVSMK